MEIKLIKDDQWYKVSKKFRTTINAYEQDAYILENGEKVVSTQVKEERNII